MMKTYERLVLERRCLLQGGRRIIWLSSRAQDVFEARCRRRMRELCTLTNSLGFAKSIQTKMLLSTFGDCLKLQLARAFARQVSEFSWWCLHSAQDLKFL